MANKIILTDEEVEAEIARLKGSEAVKLARKVERAKNKRRRYLYHLRDLEKRGIALLAEDKGVKRDAT